MRLSSSAFKQNEPIPARYTCDGDNVHPPLSISDIPDGTKSLALIVDDPDAPHGTWVHWTLWNIPPATLEIPEGTVPTNTVEGMTSFGRTGYGGPCPPSGEHRYRFLLSALDTALAITNTATRDDLDQAMEGHVLAHAELIGLYRRGGRG